MLFWPAGVTGKTGKSRPGGGQQALMRSRGQRAGWLSRGRPTNRSKASTDAAAEYRVRPPPGQVSARGAEVGAGLAGDVSLEAADDLGLGFPFFGAAFDVGAGGRV